MRRFQRRMQWIYFYMLGSLLPSPTLMFTFTLFFYFMLECEPHHIKRSHVFLFWREKWFGLLISSFSKKNVSVYGWLHTENLTLIRWWRVIWYKNKFKCALLISRESHLSSFKRHQWSFLVRFFFVQIRKKCFDI